METYRVADFIADFISSLGVEDVFLLPGGGAMHLVDAVGKHNCLSVVACLHEQAAGIAAEAYSRVHESGLGVAIVTTGPGATNVLTPLVGAWIESVPMLVVSGQVKRSDLLDGAPLRQKGVQEVDIVSMVKGITKYAKTVTDANTIKCELERAVYEAKQGRAGPVWLDIPLDIQGSPVNPELLEGFSPSAKDVSAACDSAVADLIHLLSHAKRPLVLAGHGVRLAGAASTFREVIEKLGLPVVTTWNALDLLPYDHPMCVGRPGVVALRGPNFAVQNCDLLISIGCRLDNIVTAYNPGGFAREARKVVIDIDKNELEKLDMAVELPIVSDAGEFLTRLNEFPNQVDPKAYANWVARCQEWKRRYPVNDGKPFSNSAKISHFQFADTISDILPENSLIATGSSGLAVEAFYTAFRNKEGQRVFLTSGLGSMGYGLPAAIGACVANGRKPTFAIESDGSLQLNLQELMTLQSYNLPICLIVMNNQGYCSIRNTQRGYFNGRYVGTGPESGMLLPDLESLAKVYGMGYERVSEPRLLAPSLANAINHPFPRLVEVELISDETLSPKVTAIPQMDGSMISMPLEDMTPLLPIEELKAQMDVPLLPLSKSVRS